MSNARHIQHLPRLAYLTGLALVLLLLPTPLEAQYKVVHLEKPFNTPGNESGAIVVGDTILSYSSMPPAGNGGAFGMNRPRMQLMQARIAKNGKVSRPRENRWGLNNKRDHTGNLCLDPVSQDIYFTRGSVETLHCDIWFAKKMRRRGWEKPMRLKGKVNDKQYTATQPSVQHLDDGTAVLYFVSDRPGGVGGMDIWYSLVSDGVAGEPVNLGPNVNSPDDEYTPFYDQTTGVLYFSSDRMGGKGGFDIYCSVGSRNTWQRTEAVCNCLNSEHNDLYFTVTDHSPEGIPTAGYLASNRKDSYFVNDSACCNDLYRWGIDSALLFVPQIDTTPKVDTTVQLVRKFMFPLFLYFHNDEPDPMSRQPVTETSYSKCQQHYSELRNDYIAHQSSAEDSLRMQVFFDTCVDGNYRRVEQLFTYIESLLDADMDITITIAGYASAVFKEDYNQILSRRRIGSFINMVRTWKGGVLAEALADGRLFIRQQPHGAVAPTTESQSTDPVYGLPAALARRIEIIGCEVRE